MAQKPPSDQKDSKPASDQARNKHLPLILLFGLMLLFGIWILQKGSQQALEPDSTTEVESPQTTSELKDFDSTTELLAAGPSEELHRIPSGEPTTQPTPPPTVPQNWTVSGHLRLGKTGFLPGATIELHCFRGLTGGETLLHTATMQTDEQGRFAWTLEAPKSSVTIEVKAILEDHRAGTDVRSVVLGDPPPTDLEPYAYALNCEVIGQVVDEDRIGIANALVKCTMNRARTDPSGHFRVPITTELGQIKFQVHSAGHAPGEFAVGGLKVGENPVPVVVLRQGFHISGKIHTAQGQPIADARVSSYPPELTRTTSDELGGFEIRGLDPEARRIRFTANKPGFVANSKTFRRPKQGWEALEEPILVLSPGATVRGHVHDAQGKPITEAWVCFGTHPRRAGSSGVYTDERGAFALSPLKSGTHSIWAARKGYASNYSPVEIPSPVVDIDKVKVVLDPGHSYSGQVLNESGQPMNGVLLFPQASGPVENQSDSYATGGASTDREGRFAFPNARSPVIDLQVFADGYATLRQDIYPDEETLLYPKPAGMLAGKVIDSASGAPLESFAVRLFPAQLKEGEVALNGLTAGWSKPGMTFSNHDGTWTTGKETLPAGTITGVEVSAEGYVSTRIDRAVVETKGASSPLVISMRKE